MTILMFIFRNWKIVTASLCAFTIGFSGGKILGQSLGYAEGKTACAKEYELKTSKEYVKKSQNSRKVKHEINALDNASTDSLLIRLGIMRDPADY